MTGHPPLNKPAVPAWLAKDCLDVGLFTNDLDPTLAFWQQEIGLPFDHMLPVGGGVRQHRHDHQGSVLKINHARDPLPVRVGGGYQLLTVARQGITAPAFLTDPDGNTIKLVAPEVDRDWAGSDVAGSNAAGSDTGAIEQWAVTVCAPSREAFVGFYNGILGLPLDPVQPCAVRCGRSLILAHIDPHAAACGETDDMQRRGFRYITIQVSKVDDIHGQVIARGGLEGRAPMTLGETARISFVRDHGGNWIELSQRASLTGSLDP